MINRATALFLTGAAIAAAQIPAFPGAEGYGAYAKGGRGGDVYHVTNLNASGAGSFFEGISTVPSAGRTIVFDVSGYIRFPSGSNGTRLTSSKVTIAGQTAPGDGIGFYNNFFRISGDDVVIRHLRFRHGYYGSGGDCIDLDSGCLNAVLDHVSMQFSTDENMSSFGSPPENITLQYSLNAWGLESHSCGGLWDQNHASSHHNLWAHNHTRNPKARPNGLLEWVNNVTFDWDIGFIMGDSTSVQNWKANVINNYFICPPGNIQSKALVKGSLSTNGTPNFTVFLGGNLTDNDGNGALDGIDKGYGIVEGSSYTKSPAAIAGSPAPPVAITTDNALTAYKKVVSNSGALRLEATSAGTLRDEVDTILINKLTSQTRFHVTRESSTGAAAAGFGVLNSTPALADTDRDGMPDGYEGALGWNSAVQDHNTAVAGTTFFPAGTVAGYTRLEEYLHFMAMPHTLLNKTTAVVIDLTRYTSGFATTPTFTISNVTGGTAGQSGTGNKIVTFTAGAAAGRGGFLFTVTDAAGSTWTQQFLVCVLNNDQPNDLQWRGNGADWNTSSSFWLKSGSPAVFSNNDRVTFDDVGSAALAVNIPAAVAPLVTTVDSSANYSFSGAGPINATGILTKRGTGTLTINNTGPNTFTSIVHEFGLLSLGNFSAGGTGKLSLNGGSLYLSNGTGNPLEFNSATNITVASQHTMTGNWTGSKAVTVNGTSSHLWTLAGTWTGFTGSVTMGTGNARIRLNGNTNTMFGSSAVAVDLGSGTSALMNRNGSATPFEIGALSSTGTSTALSGTQTAIASTLNSTYNIGGRNTSSTFAGGIFDGAGGSLTNINKVGTGTWTLSGASSHTGATNVNAGALLVSGSLNGTAVSVASAALLGGSGTINGSVVANNGSFLSPATVPFTGGTLTITNGLTVGAVTMYCDLSGTPGGANDKIVVTGAPLTYSGAPYFQFTLLDGTLAAGDYDLITAPISSVPGGTPSAFQHNLPTDTRQTFTVKRPSSSVTPTRIWLEVLNDPVILTWNGSAALVWQVDGSAGANGWTGGTVTKPNFLTLDAVLFNDNAPSTAVTLVGKVQPRSIELNNSTKNYTFSGNGAIAGSGKMTKSGTGTLTITLPASVSAASTNSANSTTVTVADATGLGVGMFVEGNGVPAGTTIAAASGTTLTVSQAVTAANSAVTFTYTWRNSYSGGTVIETGSTVQLGNEAANRWGLGTGKVTFHGGTLKLYDFGPNFPGSGDFPNAMVVPLGQTGNLFTPQRGSLSGSLSGDVTGSGTLNVTVKYVRGDFSGNWSAFTGLINISAATGSEFRMSESYSPDGFPNAQVQLNANVALKHTGILAEGAGTTIAIGALSGNAGSTLLGGTTGGRALTYVIGGKGIDTTFSGVIAEQTPGSTLTNIIKVGNGTWTLAGNNSWAGGTEVVAGAMAFSGTSTSGGAANVASGATLQFVNGSLTTPEANINIGAKLAGYGAITGDMNCPGTLEGRGFASGIPGTLTIHGNAYFASTSTLRLRAGSTADLVGIDGDLALEGTVQVSLPAGTPNGRYPLLSYGGMLALGTVNLTGVPAGTTAQLSTSIAGQVDLVVGDLSDSDNDGLADSWETTNFNGSLAQTGSGDPDGDGFDNETEETAGTNPNSETSIPNFTVAYYRFEEGAAGSQVPQNFSNAVVDTAGADDNMNVYAAGAAPFYNATVPAATVPQTLAANTRSLLFDGGDDVYNGLGGPLQTRAFGSFTVEAFVRFASLTGFQTIVGRDDVFGNANGQNGIPQSLFYLSKANGSNAFRVELTTGTGTQIAVNSSSIAVANTWYHLAAVGNVGTGTLALYVNGASVGSVGGFTGLYNPANDDAWTIGRGQFSGGVVDLVNGHIDEVRFSDLPLAPSRFLVTPLAGDSDSDGLPNAWETQYFGSPTAAIAGEDSDGDGQSNEVEYLTGTHPKNGSSRFAANIVTAPGNQFSITWPSVAGKSYTILTSASPAGPWTPLASVPAAGAPAVVTTKNVDVDGSVRFYKVSLAP